MPFVSLHLAKYRLLRFRHELTLWKNTALLQCFPDGRMRLTTFIITSRDVIRVYVTSVRVQTT